MEKKNLTNSRRLKFPWNERTDKYFTAQPKINLQSFKNTLDYPKQWFKAIERGRGTPENLSHKTFN